MNELSLVFFILVIAYFAIEYWLGQRHIKHIKNNRNQVPTEFAADISIDEHQKAADYTVARKKLGLVEAAYGAVFLLIWTLGGGFDLFDNIWRKLQLDPIWTGIMFLLSISLIASILDLPFAWYRTFKLEENFGFNKTTVKTFITDLFKNTVLSLVIGVPLLWLVLWIMQSMGTNWWLYVWAAWLTFMLVMLWVYPTVIAPLFNKFSPLEDVELKGRISSLLKRTGFMSKGIFVMDGSKRSGHGNAYFTGFGKSKRIVFFDTLLESLNADEVEAVLAHELGHFKHNHIKKSILLTSALSLLGLWILGFLLDKSWFYYGLGMSNKSDYAALALFFTAAPVFLFFTTPIMSWFSRKNEYEADSFATSKTNGNDLISALVKMYKENASTLTPEPLHSLVYDSHPPAPLRISHIKKDLAT